MPLEKVVQVFEFLILLSCQFLELVLQLFRNLILVHCGVIERQNFFFFSLQSSTQFCCLEDSLAKLKVLFELLDCVSGVVGELLESSVLFFPEPIHFFLELLIIFGNVVLFLSEGIVSGPTFFLMLEDLQLQEVNFGPFSDDVSV